MRFGRFFIFLTKFLILWYYLNSPLINNDKGEEKEAG